MGLRIRQQTLVGLDCIVLEMCHGVGSLLHGEADEISVFDIVVEIVGTARVDDRVHKEKHSVHLSSACNETVDEGLIGAWNRRVSTAIALTNSDLQVFPDGRYLLPQNGEGVVDGRTQPTFHPHGVEVVFDLVCYCEVLGRALLQSYFVYIGVGLVGAQLLN